ncbi:hypothetical protein NC652_021216 [Populus alba x Populus x berolinensis]|nr:hypothetical protein NC652_021216 [Populus alba x Populus x berolinensis]
MLIARQATSLVPRQQKSVPVFVCWKMSWTL